MRSITEQEASALIGLLASAESVAREHAVEQSYRRDAMRHIGQRLLAQYHRDQAHAALDLAAALRQAQAGLADRIQEPGRRTRSRAAPEPPRPVG